MPVPLLDDESLVPIRSGYLQDFFFVTTETRCLQIRLALSLPLSIPGDKGGGALTCTWVQFSTFFNFFSARG